jgi:hypothetical protein
MKYIFLFLAIFLPGLVQAQWSLREFQATSTFGGYYEVWAIVPDSSYMVSRHTQLVKAVESQVNTNIQLMNQYHRKADFTVEIRQDLTIRSTGFYDYLDDYIEYIEIEVPGDTVYADTLFITLPPDTVYADPDTVFIEQELPLFDHVYTEVTSPARRVINL